MLTTAGENADRLTSEAALARLCGVAPIPASSGNTKRHRLHRGGDRAANSAIHLVVINRLRWHQPTRLYLEAPHPRRQDQERDHPLPQTSRRQRALPRTPDRPTKGPPNTLTMHRSVHITPYEEYGPPGQTRPDALAALCRRHHRAKTFRRWRYHRTPSGNYQWTGPHGQTYLVPPHGTSHPAN